MSPAAIWDLPPFFTQTKSTDGFLGLVMVRRGEFADQALVIAMAAGGVGESPDPRVMSSRTRRIRWIPSMPRSDGSSVSQFSNRVPSTAGRGRPAEDDHEVGIADELIGELLGSGR